MATLETERSTDALEAELERAVAGRPPYPSGTVFIETDVAGFPEILERRLAERRPIVLVSPEGSEHFIRPRRRWPWKR